MSKKKILRAYMVSMGGPAEGAVLVFAFNEREAKTIAWDEIRGWDSGEWIDCQECADEAELVNAQN